MIFSDIYKYNSVEVAKYIAAKANEERFGINMTKMQKLLYIVYGVYLRVYETRLTNEHPQAWPYGPVFPTTRNKLLKIDLYDLNMNSVDDEIKSDKGLCSVTDFVFAKFGTWNAGQLSEWSHRDASPWFYTTKMDGFKWGMQIPDELIYNYFKDLVSVNG